jgi:hypothetical protein
MRPVTSVNPLFFNGKILCRILSVRSVLHSMLVLDLRKTAFVLPFTFWCLSAVQSLHGSVSVVSVTGSNRSCVLVLISPWSTRSFQSPFLVWSPSPRVRNIWFLLLSDPAVGKSVYGSLVKVHRDFGFQRWIWSLPLPISLIW